MKEFQCYSFNPDIASARVPITDIQLVIQPICTSDRQVRYYMVNTDPIISSHCEMMMTLYSYKEPFLYYATVTVSALSIAVVVLFIIYHYVS